MIDQLGPSEARRDRIDPNTDGGDFKRQRSSETENPSLCRAIGAASRQPDKRRGRCDADDRAALAARRHARDRFGRAEEEPVKMGRDDRREVSERNLAHKADTLDAGVVDENVDLACLCINRLEGLSNAGWLSHVSFEIGDVLARLVGRDFVEGKNARAVGNQPLGDRVADAARGAAHNGYAARKRTGQWFLLRPFNTSASRR